MNAPAPLGEPHNGGRRVRLLDDGWVHKPRTVAWERAFLGKDSPLRSVLDERFGDLPRLCYATTLPRLSFIADPAECGRVEFLRLDPPPPVLAVDGDFWESLGASIALICGLGLGDLHRTNMAFGAVPSGATVFGPIDIECILNRFDLPSQSHLLPSSRIAPERCGLAAVRAWLDGQEHKAAVVVAAACYGYLRGLALLREHAAAIQAALTASVPDPLTPIRVVARSTSIYVKLLNGSASPDSTAPALSSCERFQLERGDVPYYFRFRDSKQIFFFDSDCRPTPATLNADLTGPIERQALCWTEWTAPTDSSTLAKAGVLQLAGFLASESAPFQSEHRGMRVDVDARAIRLRSPFGISVECARP